MEKKPAPPAPPKAAGIAALVIFGVVILAAIGIFAYRKSGDYFASSNTSQPPPRPPATIYAPTPTQAPITVPSVAPTVQPTTVPPMSDNTGSINANLPMAMGGNQNTSNANLPVRNNNLANTNSSNQKVNAVAIQECVTNSLPDEQGRDMEDVEEGDRLFIHYRDSPKSEWYLVTLPSGTVSWIHGNCFRFTNRP